MRHKHIVLLLWSASPDEPEICAAPFFNAAAAAAMDAEVEIYFTSRSVRLLLKGVAEALPSGPRQRESVYAFMQQAARHGAKFFACSQALAEHEISASDLIPEVCGIAGAATYMARAMDESWTCLAF